MSDGTYISIVKALYDYAPQSEDELEVKEDQLLFLIDDSDPDWFNTKHKPQDSTVDVATLPSGLVPANYVEEAPYISVAKAIYDYEANAEGELSIAEDEVLHVYEKEDDWWLVKSQKPGGRVGYVPGSYVEEEGGAAPASAHHEEPVEEVEPEPEAPAEYEPESPEPPPEPVTRVVSKPKAGDIQTWSVTELDKKNKKKKGTLGVGNGALFFASESDKTPVQQWPMSSVTSVTIDKSKHVLLEITSPGSSSPTSLHFTAGSKDVAEAIVTKLESSRDASDGPSVPKAGVSLPPPSPPPPPQPTPPPRPHVAFVDTPAVIAEPEPPSRPPRVESSAIPAIPKPSQPKPSTPSPAPTSRPSTGRASIEKTLPTNTRIWHDRTGQFKVEAEFLGIKDGKIWLHKANGVVIEVPAAKMSPEDLAFVDKVSASKKSTPPDDDNTPLALAPKNSSRPSSAMKSSPTPKRPNIDWFQFFLDAGCDVDDCSRYASSFERDKIDDSILPDIKPDTLRALGLREGDIIRVSKVISQRAGVKKVDDRAERAQLLEDERLARSLQEEENAGRSKGGRPSSASPAPNLFTSPGGILKNNTQRRGRPTQQPSKAAPLAVDANSLASASTQIRTAPADPPLLSPTSQTQGRKTSASSSAVADFDDDAWTPRPSSAASERKTSNASSILRPMSAAASTPSARPAAPPVASPPTAPPVQRPATAQSDTSAAQQSSGPRLPDTFDILAKIDGMRVASAPPAPAPPPAPSPQQIYNAPRSFEAGLGMGNSPAPIGALLTAQQTGAFHLGSTSPPPRGPFAPVPQNQGLLNPLIPTNTGFNSFVPIRLNQNPSPAPNGFGLQPPLPAMPLNAQSTGFGSSPFSGGVPMQSQPTGFMGAYPSLPGGLQQYGGNTTSSLGFNSMAAPSQPSFFSSMNLNPVSSPPPQAPPPPVNHSPANVFASMKAGSFANLSAPQTPDKYDALRQPNAFLQPQPTGWAPLNPGTQASGYMPGSYAGFR